MNADAITCPSWCTDHDDFGHYDAGTRRANVHVDLVQRLPHEDWYIKPNLTPSVSLLVDPPGGSFAEIDLAPADARALAASLIAAAEKLENEAAATSPKHLGVYTPESMSLDEVVWNQMLAASPVFGAA